MLDISKISVRILIGVVVIIFGLMMLKYFSQDKESDNITKYAARVKPTIKSILKKPVMNNKKMESKKTKDIQWAPSAVDATMSPDGEWDTNRNPASFVTNITSGFPESDAIKNYSSPSTKWTPDYPTNFALPDITMKSELGDMPEPALGSDDLFAGELGNAM